MTNETLFDKELMKRVLDAETVSAKTMVNTLYKKLKPTSVIDIGCGPGHFSNEFKLRNVDITAIDISNDAKSFIDKDINFINHDLRTPIDLNKKYDMVLCLEVVEHIEEEFEDIICNTLVNHVGKYLVVSIARENQMAPGHVNLKKLSYWIEKFKSLGLEFSERITANIRTEWIMCSIDTRPESYFINNLLVFVKEDTSGFNKVMELTNPYKDLQFDDNMKLDIQGWNSTNVIFRDLIEHEKPKLIIEVGSWKGASAIHMANVIKELKLDTKIICIDTWLGGHETWDKETEDYTSLNLKNGYPTLYRQFLYNVVNSGHSDIIVPLSNTSNIAFLILKKLDIKADLIYIDGSHYEEDVYNDMKNYNSLLNECCIMFGDDYWQEGVKKATERFSKEFEKQITGQNFWMSYERKIQ